MCTSFLDHEQQEHTNRTEKPRTVKITLPVFLRLQQGVFMSAAPAFSSKRKMELVRLLSSLLDGWKGMTKSIKHLKEYNVVKQ